MHLYDGGAARRSDVLAQGRRREFALEQQFARARYRRPCKALRQEGYDAVAEPVPEGHDVVVACPQGRDENRARVRATIQRTNASNVEGGPYDVPPVKFDDE